MTAFLTQGQGEDSGYAPASGQITGILKTMHDEMSASLAEATSAEGAAIKAYDSLMASKAKEINALTKAVESKMPRVGEAAVVAQGKSITANARGAMEL